LYLWHWPIFYTVSSKHPTSPFSALPLQIGFTFLAAALSFYLIEQPFLKLKRRFRPGANRVESVSP
jgi:peptidoglycan/LPS O-acetylase OafA/YrhL